MIHRSPFPDVEIPDCSLTELLVGGAARHGAAPALVDALTGETLTYTRFAESVLAHAGGLAGLGLGPGGVAGLMSPNQPRWAVAAHAVIATGAALTTLNPMLTVAEAARQLTACGARALIVADALADKGREIAEAARVPHLLTIGGLPSGPEPSPEIDPGSDAVLPFSSGTTGKAKGVRLTHRNLVANLVQHIAGWRVGPDDVQAAVLPFFHVYGFTIILGSGLLGGAKIVTLPRFEVCSYPRTLAEHRVTRAYFAPPMVLALANAPEVERHDLSSLRYALSGAAPLDVGATLRAEARLGCRIRQGYGMTEASPGTHQVVDDAFATTPPGSVGVLAPNTEARLVRPGTDDDVAAGETGELLVRGPQVMAGYLGDPAATAATITGGWLHTGDLVRVDSGGGFWVVDRLKELIKYKGYQVAPAELESVLLTHPDVLDAAVVGVPHPEGGEAPKAFVVTGRTVGAAELMAFVAREVAPYKKIRFVEFVESIPKSPTGKILRRVLTEMSAATGASGP